MGSEWTMATAVEVATGKAHTDRPERGQLAMTVVEICVFGTRLCACNLLVFGTIVVLAYVLKGGRV
jgi:hypothetical protein